MAAASHTSYYLLLLFILLALSESSVSARLLSGCTHSGLALPGDDDIIGSPANPSESNDRVKHALPRFVRESGKGAPATLALSGRSSFGHMFLNVLPKRAVTPSGPSGGTNDSKN